MIELKTETASHRPAQIPAYLTLADHHYPGYGIDLTYLTPPMAWAASPPPDYSRLAHFTWAEITPVLQTVWVTGTAAERQVLTLLTDALDSIGTRWRSTHPGSSTRAEARPIEPGPQEDLQRRTNQESLLDELMALAEATAQDGRQRGLNRSVGGLGDLQRLRVAARQRIGAAPPPAADRRVRPWIWNAGTSGGRPLTQPGARTGFELRLSRYRALAD
ncbi:hypothetical protein [Actinomadura napierensis]|uniref:Uncharacterized protein n=1 Tax=Actinomadura napierensis TaxID=267854 RepID=A0ABN3ADG9_9ACTN